MQLLAAKFTAIASEIDTVNAQIAALQAKLSELQERQQQLLSVEQACQSALSQVDTALMMLHHVDPDEITTFKDALVSKFNSEAIALIEPTTDAETTIDTPTEPTAPTPPDTNPMWMLHPPQTSYPHPSQTLIPTSKKPSIAYHFKVFASLPSLKNSIQG